MFLRIYCQKIMAALNTVGSNLKRMKGNLGINIMSALNKGVIINKLSCDASNDSDSGTWFYTTDMFRCVWCDCGVYVCCTL